MALTAASRTDGQTPSTIAYDVASSDDGMMGDDTGGLSKVGSFADDPSVEIVRLKALLRQREDELADKTKLLTQREGLLRQSKGARSLLPAHSICLASLVARAGARRWPRLPQPVSRLGSPAVMLSDRDH